MLLVGTSILEAGNGQTKKRKKKYSQLVQLGKESFTIMKVLYTNHVSPCHEQNVQYENLLRCKQTIIIPPLPGFLVLGTRTMIFISFLFLDLF